MRLGVKPEVKLRAILEMSNTLARTLKLDDVLQSLLDGLLQGFSAGRQRLCDAGRRRGPRKHRQGVAGSRR